MSSAPTCPECATVWQDGETCQDCFYQMLYWEAENPGYGEVHHLMVLCYYLQHPSLYSPEGLEAGMRLLVDFVEGNLSPQEARRRMQGKVSSRRRHWKLVATPQASGAYPYPVRWEYLAKDVVEGGASGYCQNVRKWAQSALEALKASGNC